MLWMNVDKHMLEAISGQRQIERIIWEMIEKEEEESKPTLHITWAQGQLAGMLLSNSGEPRGVQWSWV